MDDDMRHGIRIRPEAPADAPAILDMRDAAVAWTARTDSFLSGTWPGQGARPRRVG